MIDPEILAEFLSESQENLDHLDDDLLAMEQGAADREAIARIFRTIHTIKGSCGFLELERLESLTHVGENLLSRMRDGERAMDDAAASCLMEMVDAIRATLESLEASGSEDDVDYGDLVDRLTQITEGKSPAPAKPEASAEAESSEDAEPAESPPEAAEPEAEAAATSEPSEAAPEPAKAPEAKPKEAPKAAAKPRAGAARSDTTLRVDVRILDRLLNLVGELVLARNQLLEQSGGRASARRNPIFHGIDNITSSLQEEVMKTRMQPVGTIIGKAPRMVRDIAKACGKQVVVEVKGQETELDRGVVQAIKDPLTHLLRNAVDHGIEDPDGRAAAGKSPQGNVCIEALHEGGQVKIRIRDDGKGIDPEKIAARALERGLVTAEQTQRMKKSEILRLLCTPGFSTAEQVTNISGRGVGMDVVKTHIEKLGGSLEIDSVPGEGTQFDIAIPLTLAIVPALVISVGEQPFAVPHLNLVEMLRIGESEGDCRVETVAGSLVVRSRGRLLPLVSLGRLLGLEGAEALEEGVAEGGRVVVVQNGALRAGLLVDRVHGGEEIVVKALDDRVKAIGLYAGATILGDGRVALILDVGAIVHGSRGMRGADGDAEASAAAQDARDDGQSMLVVEVGEQEPMAVPLAEVTRLEEIERARLERLSNHWGVQYRGGVLPVVDLGGFFGSGEVVTSIEEPTLHMVVSETEERQVGFLVRSVVDIGYSGGEIQYCRNRPGVQGNTVVRDRIVSVLSLDAIAAQSRIVDIDRSAA